MESQFMLVAGFSGLLALAYAFVAVGKIKSFAVQN